MAAHQGPFYQTHCLSWMRGNPDGQLIEQKALAAVKFLFMHALARHADMKAPPLGAKLEFGSRWLIFRPDAVSYNPYDAATCI